MEKIDMKNKEKFKAFLEDRGYYESFCKNIKKQNGATFDNFKGASNGFFNAISSSMTWAKTPEGTLIWGKLSNEWNNMLMERKSSIKKAYKSIW